MISIVNYGLGNLGSIANMLKYMGKPAIIVDHPEQLVGAEKIILPGVGAFDAGMQLLHSRGWIEVLNHKALEERVPVLGICLGMQLMTHASEEGKEKGLGWIPGAVKKFNFPENGKLKVPHMGWNEVHICKEQQLLSNPNGESRFYFVHSYYVDLMEEKDALLRTHYGHDFTSGFQRENIIGVQFHPEKSHRFGMELLKNFADLDQGNF